MVAFFLQRFVVTSAQLFDQVAPRQRSPVSATAAAKIFDAPAARSENVAIAQSSLMWRAALGARTWLAPAGVYYEAFQSWGPEGDPAGERRDFRSLAPMLELRTGAVRTASISESAAGYRWLVFKPDRDFDFNGPTAGVNLRWLYDTESGADWEARAGAALEYRRFGGPALVGNCPARRPSLRRDRRCATDDFLMAQARADAHGPRAARRSVTCSSHNASNSFGETLIRHIGFARVATRAAVRPLPGGARGPAVRSFYRDPIPIAQTTDMAQMVGGKQFVTIEDENRSSVRVDLSRDIAAPLRAILRYTFYANELGGNSGTYRRHTLLLSLAFTYEK